jgi:hypothetical protein
MTTIVKIFPAAENGSTSRKPTVVTVVTVWYSASSAVKPSTTYPIVPAVVTAARATIASPKRRHSATPGG